MQYPLDTGIVEILSRLKQFSEERPQQKLYLHLDKSFYAAGENIWYKSYLTDAAFNTLDSQSRVIYVELLDANNKIIDQQMIYSPVGVGYGDFRLADTLREGRYAVRAYTNYMRNFSEDFFFLKEISVFSPLKDPTANLQPLGLPELLFFPEGGNFVAGVMNKLAFKVLSPDGKGMEASGEIVDEDGKVVQTFRTEHKGMGLTALIPEAGKKYIARITEPTFYKDYLLPEVEINGYQLEVDALSNDEYIRLAVQHHNLNQEPVHVIVQSGGQAYYAVSGVLKDNHYITQIPRKKLPDGIAQITIFDESSRPVAERLVYQHNPEETLELTATTDKTTYGERDKITLDISSLYRDGSPAAGYFSVSVYDDATIEDPYPLTITNYLALVSDLKGHIEEPGYYFKDQALTTRSHLDLLMLVQGWRRFTWKEVLEETSAPLVFPHEQGLAISGRVLKEFSNKKSPESSILKILTMEGDVLQLYPAENGRFYTDDLIHYDPVPLVFQTESKKGRKQPYKVSLDAWKPPLVEGGLSSFVPFDASVYVSRSRKIMAMYPDDRLMLNLEEVVIQEKKVSNMTGDERRWNPHGIPVHFWDVDEQMNEGIGYPTISDMISGRIPGFFDGKYRGGKVLYMVDNMFVTEEVFSWTSPAHVAFIELITGATPAEGNKPVLSITTRKGPGKQPPLVGIDQAEIRGFYKAREFYSPNYAVAEESHSLNDSRTTLYWEPMVITDQNGKASLTFYTGDVATRYRVVVEGITADGYPGVSIGSFEVR